MTLDEAIKHAEKVAERERENAQVYDKVKNNNLYHPDKITCEQAAKRCKECVEEQRQLSEWLKELKQLREQTRWIPVSERLPYNHEYIKNNGLFNVSDGNRSYSEWFDIYDTEKFGEPTITGFRVDYAVTAWMPLPEPYKASPAGAESEEV